jgi:fucose permease
MENAISEPPQRFSSAAGGLMLWTIVGILLVLWLLGVVGHVGGSLIHLLLVVAVVVFLINLVSGRRPV